MSAACWYVRALKRGDFTPWARSRGAGKFRPVVLVCTCGQTSTFEVVCAVGAECVRCGDPLVPEERLDAAHAALALGADAAATFGELLGIPQAPDQIVYGEPDQQSSDQQRAALMAAHDAAKGE